MLQCESELAGRLSIHRAGLQKDIAFLVPAAQYAVLSAPAGRAVQPSLTLSVAAAMQSHPSQAACNVP